MRKSLIGLLAIGVVLMYGAASAAIYQPPKVWDDLSGGEQRRYPEPVKDPVRAAYCGGRPSPPPMRMTPSCGATAAKSCTRGKSR